jgi:hypothetical protein
MVRLVVCICDIDLQLAEAVTEAAELIRVQRLAREAEHAVFAQCAQDSVEIAIRQRFRQIDVGDARAKGLERDEAGVNLWAIPESAEV